MSTEHFKDITKTGERVETLTGKHSPEDVMIKIQLLANDEHFKKSFNEALNNAGLGMTIEANEHMFAGLSPKKLEEVTSLIGDIRWHAQAANDSKYDWSGEINSIVQILKEA